MQCALAVIVLAGVLTFSATARAAEGTPQLVAGSRVRVEVSAAEERFVGRLLSLDDRQLKLQVEDENEPRMFPREDVAALARSTGRRSRAWGALIGASAGLALAATIGFVEDRGEDYPATTKVVLLSSLLVPIGAAVGLAIPPGERWEKVPLDNVQLSVGPVPGRGAGVFVACGF